MDLLRAAPFGDGAQDVERGGQRDVVGDGQRGFVAFVIAAVQHEAAPGLHRPAESTGKSGVVGGHVGCSSFCTRSRKFSPSIGLLMMRPIAPFAANGRT